MGRLGAVRSVSTKTNTGRSTGPVHYHMSALRRLIPALSNRQLEALRRGLLDVLTDVTNEKAVRDHNFPLV